MSDEPRSPKTMQFADELAAIKPRQVRKDPHLTEAVMETAQAFGFTQRHADEPPPAAKQDAGPEPDQQEAAPGQARSAPAGAAPGYAQAPWQGRRRRSARTQNLSVKLKPETCTRIYELAEEMGVTVLAEFFERAVELMEKDLDQRKRGSRAK